MLFWTDLFRHRVREKYEKPNSILFTLTKFRTPRWLPLPHGSVLFSPATTVYNRKVCFDELEKKLAARRVSFHQGVCIAHEVDGITIQEPARDFTFQHNARNQKRCLRRGKDRNKPDNLAGFGRITERIEISFHSGDEFNEADHDGQLDRDDRIQNGLAVRASRKQVHTSRQRETARPRGSGWLRERVDVIPRQKKARWFLQS